jgi:hypothetical protein
MPKTLKPLTATLSQAIHELVRDGDSVALEGFTHLIPFAAGHEIIRQRKRNLTQDGTQIYGWTQFWKCLSMPFYGYTKSGWPDYLPPTFVRRFSTEPLRVVRREVKVAGGPIQLEFDM